MIEQLGERDAFSGFRVWDRTDGRHDAREKAIEEPASLCQVFVLSIGEEAKRESLKITDFQEARHLRATRFDGAEHPESAEVRGQTTGPLHHHHRRDELDKGVYLVKEMDTGDQIEVESFWVENYILEKLATL